MTRFARPSLARKRRRRDLSIYDSTSDPVDPSPGHSRRRARRRDALPQPRLELARAGTSVRSQARSDAARRPRLRLVRRARAPRAPVRRAARGRRRGAIVGVACDGADPKPARRRAARPRRWSWASPTRTESGRAGTTARTTGSRVRVHLRHAARAATAPGPGPADRAVPAVILRLADARWRAQLTPMTRLLLALAYTDGTARRVSYAPPSAVATSPTDATSEVALACGWSARSWHAALDQPALERFVVDAGADRADACGEARAALRVGPSEDAKRPSGPAGKKRVSFGAAKAERGVGCRRTPTPRSCEPQSSARAPPPRGPRRSAPARTSARSPRPRERRRRRFSRNRARARRGPPGRVAAR